MPAIPAASQGTETMKNQAEMTMKTLKSSFAYTVTVDGVVAGTRKSKRANYTCAAVKLVDRDKALAVRLAAIEASRKSGSVARKNYDFGISEAAVDRIAADFPSNYSPERIEKEKQEKRDYLAKYPTFESYLNEGIAKAHAIHAKSAPITPVVLCYSSKLDLLQKAIARDFTTETGDIVVAMLKEAA